MEITLEEVTVSLVDIDAPVTSKRKRHPGQPYSQRATKYLAKMVLNKVVDVNQSLQETP